MLVCVLGGVTHRLAQKPMTWKKGVKQTVPACATLGANGEGIAASVERASHSMPAWLCGTALGVPVVPPVKTTAATLDGSSARIAAASDTATSRVGL